MIKAEFTPGEVQSLCRLIAGTSHLFREKLGITWVNSLGLEAILEKFMVRISEKKETAKFAEEPVGIEDHAN